MKFTCEVAIGLHCGTWSQRSVEVEVEDDVYDLEAMVREAAEDAAQSQCPSREEVAFATMLQWTAVTFS